MADLQVEKNETTYPWATAGWAWKEFFKYAWAGNIARSVIDYLDLWLNRDRYIKKYFTTEEIEALTKKALMND